MTTTKDKMKKLAKGKPLALMSDKATELLIKASNDQSNDESALDDADVIGYCREWWAKYGESVPVAYSSMMRRLPNRLRLASRLRECLDRLNKAGIVSFKYSYLSKNVVRHPDHANAADEKMQHVSMDEESPIESTEEFEARISKALK